MAETELQARVRADLDRRLDELPLLPAVLTRIVSMDPGAPDFAARVEELARLDPPFAARLLRLAASARGEHASIPEAIVRVGARPLAETVTALAVMRVFVPTTAGQRNLWLHALGVARTARCIAQLAAPRWQVAPERAYLAGLLHDLGRFVMYDRSPQELGQVDETAWESPAELVAAEVRICGYDHAFLGALACERWSFPDVVTAMVREHHLYGREDHARRAHEVAALVRLVQAADAVNILVLRHPDYVLVPETRRVAILEQLRRRLGWSDADAPCRSDALAPELPHIDEECRRLAGVLGLVASCPFPDRP